MRALIVSMILLVASSAHAGNCYYPAYCPASQIAQYGIVYHYDTGTYWNREGTVEYAEGKIQDRYSPTGWSTYYYVKMDRPSKAALVGYRPLAAQGASIFGYQETTTATYGQAPSYQASAAVYAPDYSQFLNEAARLAEQSQSLNSEAVRGFMSSTTLLNAQQIELAKIDHVRDAAIAALNAAKGPQPESVQRAITLTLKPDSQGNLQVTTSQSKAIVSGGGDPTDSFMTIVATNCSKCHAAASQNAEARKHLRLEDFSQWDAKTFSAISAAVEGDKMPPHKPLSRADKSVIYAMETFVNAGNRPTPPQLERVPIDPDKIRSGEQPPRPTQLPANPEPPPQAQPRTAPQPPPEPEPQPEKPQSPIPPPPPVPDQPKQ